jgi:hypothetical protein
MSSKNQIQMSMVGTLSPVKDRENLGGIPRMLFFPISALFSENQARNINYMAVLDFLKMP